MVIFVIFMSTGASGDRLVTPHKLTVSFFFVIQFRWLGLKFEAHFKI